MRCPRSPPRSGENSQPPIAAARRHAERWGIPQVNIAPHVARCVGTADRAPRGSLPSAYCRQRRRETNSNRSSRCCIWLPPLPATARSVDPEKNLKRQSTCRYPGGPETDQASILERNLLCEIPPRHIPLYESRPHVPLG